MRPERQLSGSRAFGPGENENQNHWHKIYPGVLDVKITRILSGEFTEKLKMTGPPTPKCDINRPVAGRYGSGGRNKTQTQGIDALYLQNALPGSTLMYKGENLGQLS